MRAIQESKSNAGACALSDELYVIDGDGPILRLSLTNIPPRSIKIYASIVLPQPAVLSQSRMQLCWETYDLHDTKVGFHRHYTILEMPYVQRTTTLFLASIFRGDHGRQTKSQYREANQEIPYESDLSIVNVLLANRELLHAFGSSRGISLIYRQTLYFEPITQLKFCFIVDRDPAGHVAWL